MNCSPFCRSSRQVETCGGWKILQGRGGVPSSYCTWADLGAPGPRAATCSDPRTVAAPHRRGMAAGHQPLVWRVQRAICMQGGQPRVRWRWRCLVQPEPGTRWNISCVLDLIAQRQIQTLMPARALGRQGREQGTFDQTAGIPLSAAGNSSSARRCRRSLIGLLPVGLILISMSVFFLVSALMAGSWLLILYLGLLLVIHYRVRRHRPLFSLSALSASSRGRAWSHHLRHRPIAADPCSILIRYPRHGNPADLTYRADTVCASPSTWCAGVL